METNFYRSTGLSLTIGSFLAIVTMILHPAGGDIAHIIKVAVPIKIAHSLAICCLPFILFGFYGLTHRLSEKWKLSTLALIVIAFGLFAAMLAAMFNGLILPSFLSQYSENIEQSQNTLLYIINYGFAINKALDYVFIISLCFAITIYSLLLIRSGKLPKFIGYLGVLILIVSIVGAVSNYAFTSLIGFRIFVFSIAAWILFSGIALIRLKE
ncbi:hypothetical protein SAMN04487910_2617 [Aquimarina amphilecti]|uniref:DUF4386 domain-containing protein n=1 Tax=Aquimarina amphilecti TaxID=1038014 RepID=A0A1H7QLS4_AQUAM|nr:hypothetical protein [Aquimarina amphilecti]SEL49091.1 hypothetical protein SAMN04487910_2617 [Aquimarina amphilecti]